ncbi:alpha/beta fold hydrolase [Solimonas terrae]|uniref:Alpha/beta hydrolase n=1 Tax=Solimonas terrae TaxID=1396819 RepID=A0A6M2BWS3_9GAMM|nr:alpha/beta hydrolase [Solimonas terrae]NGY06641.1 alpha/beta hydrolase [Solimonas terrae]
MKLETEVRRYPVPGGIEVEADVGGDPSRPAVILMHGGGQTRHSWGGALRELLARGFHVINLDARGHGDSDWAPDADYSLQAMTGDLRAVIATLSSPPALVGASMGGITSLYAVGNGEPTLASALVLVDVVPRVDAAGGKKIGEFMRANADGFATLGAAADAVSAYNPHRPRPKDISGLMKNLRLREDGRLHWHWDPRFVNNAARVEPPQFAELLLDAADRVRIPTLLVRGMQSDIVSEAGVEEFRQHLPALEIYDVVGAGHMVAGDRNDAFNDGVIGFLEKHLPVRA